MEEVAPAKPAASAQPWWKQRSLVIAIAGGATLVVIALAIGLFVVKARSDQRAAAHEAAIGALAPFRKLLSATEVGVTYEEYGKLVRDAQYSVDTYEPSDATGKSVKQWLQAAALCYSTAYDRWDAKIQAIGDVGYDEASYDNDIQTWWSNGREGVQGAMKKLGIEQAAF